MIYDDSFVCFQRSFGGELRTNQVPNRRGLPVLCLVQVPEQNFIHSMRDCLKILTLSHFFSSLMISPEVDSRGMRYRLLYDHSDFLGETRAFDGIQLFLPYQLPQQVGWQDINIP